MSSNLAAPTISSENPLKNLSQCVLYSFIDSAYLRGRDIVELARQLCAGGSDIIQLRAKNWKPEEIRAAAIRIQPVLGHAGVPLVINDYPEIAREIGADLCHLGQEDFFDSAAGKGLLPAGSFGLSTHSPAQAQRALAASPAYIAIGPVFPTATKPGVPAVTLDCVRWAAANVPVPWFAIGGITLDNLAQVLAAGAKRICVVSAILNQDDVTGACREFRKQLDDETAE